MKAPLLCLTLSLLFAAPLRAEVPVFELIIKEHRFQPDSLEVPAGQRIKLLVKNQDPGPEEFESYELNREKIISGNSQAVIYVGPLEPGKYPFFGEFHPKTAQGMLLAK